MTLVFTEPEHSYSSNRRTVTDAEGYWQQAVGSSSSPNFLSNDQVASMSSVGGRRRSQSPWREDVLEQTASLAAGARSNWDSYGALPPNRQAILLVLRVLDLLDDFVRSTPVVSLTSGGGVMLSWKSESHAVDLESTGHGATVYLCDDQKGVEWEGNLSHAHSNFVDALLRASS